MFKLLFAVIIVIKSVDSRRLEPGESAFSYLDDADDDVEGSSIHPEREREVIFEGNQNLGKLTENFYRAIMKDFDNLKPNIESQTGGRSVSETATHDHSNNKGISNQFHSSELHLKPSNQNHLSTAFYRAIGSMIKNKELTLNEAPTLSLPMSVNQRPVSSSHAGSNGIHSRGSTFRSKFSQYNWGRIPYSGSLANSVNPRATKSLYELPPINLVPTGNVNIPTVSVSGRMAGLRPTRNNQISELPPITLTAADSTFQSGNTAGNLFGPNNPFGHLSTFKAPNMLPTLLNANRTVPRADAMQTPFGYQHLQAHSVNFGPSGEALTSPNLQSPSISTSDTNKTANIEHNAIVSNIAKKASTIQPRIWESVKENVEEPESEEIICKKCEEKRRLMLMLKVKNADIISQSKPSKLSGKKAVPFEGAQIPNEVPQPIPKVIESRHYVKHTDAKGPNFVQYNTQYNVALIDPNSSFWNGLIQEWRKKFKTNVMPIGFAVYPEEATTQRRNVSMRISLPKGSPEISLQASAPMKLQQSAPIKFTTEKPVKTTEIIIENLKPIKAAKKVAKSPTTEPSPIFEKILLTTLIPTTRSPKVTSTSICTNSPKAKTIINEVTDEPKSSTTDVEVEESSVQPKVEKSHNVTTAAPKIRKKERKVPILSKLSHYDTAAQTNFTILEDYNEFEEPRQNSADAHKEREFPNIESV